MLYTIQQEERIAQLEEQLQRHGCIDESSAISLPEQDEGVVSPARIALSRTEDVDDDAVDLNQP